MYVTVATIGMYLAGGRWVEIGVLGSTQLAPPLIEFAALTYDIIFEYAFFPNSLVYVLARGLKLIKTKEPE